MFHRAMLTVYIYVHPQRLRYSSFCLFVFNLLYLNKTKPNLTKYINRTTIPLTGFAQITFNETQGWFKYAYTYTCTYHHLQKIHFCNVYIDTHTCEEHMGNENIMLHGPIKLCFYHNCVLLVRSLSLLSSRIIFWHKQTVFMCKWLIFENLWCQ